MDVQGTLFDGVEIVDVEVVSDETVSTPVPTEVVKEEKENIGTDLFVVEEVSDYEGYKGNSATELEIQHALSISRPLDKAMKFTPVFNSNAVNIFAYLSQRILEGLKRNGKNKRNDENEPNDENESNDKTKKKTILIKPPNATVGYRIQRNQVNQISLDGRSAQFLWYLIAKFTMMSPPDSDPNKAAENTLIVFKNSEVAKIFGISMQYARRMIMDSYLTLKAIEWEIHDYLPTLGAVDIQVSPVQTRIDVKKFGYSGIRFNTEFAHYLAHTYIQYLPIEILSIVPKHNPNSISFAIKLVSNYNINYKTPQRNIISVESLMSVACEIPKYKELIKNANARPNHRIIRPFLRDMNKLKELGIISDWHFRWKRFDGKVDPNSKSITYADFIQFNVYYEIDNYPNKHFQQQ